MNVGEESGVYVDGQTYLPAAWVDANLNERFYWDANEEILVYALPEEIVKSDETTVDEDGKRSFTGMAMQFIFHWL